MVWIPGGAFARGAGSLAVYDGSRFARDGVVCVTINYRLGVDGFLQIDNTVSNRGLLDQVAALRWVQENIEAFGGDPANVTVFGESAGAFSLGALLAMPAARGLFRRAILQSGAAHHSTSAETARMVRNNLAQALGSDVTVEALSRIPLPRLIDEQTTLAGELVVRPDPSRWGEIAVNGMMFEPIVDGEVLPTRPIDGIRSGTSRAIDIMVGTTEEEWRFFTVPTGLHDLVTYEHLEYFTGAYGAEPKGLLPVYRSSRLDASPGDILCAVVTDWFFRIPALRLAEAHAQNGGSPFVYEFGWRSPMFEEKLGSCHALEIGFVFDNLDKAGPMKGERPPQQLADRMHRAWVDFATNGDPGWKPYSPQRRAVMRFSEDTELLVDPRADERVVWDGIR
jgi:para-nitrobenzyl esterase